MIQVHPGLLPNHRLYLLDLDLPSHHICLTPMYHIVYDPYLVAPTVRPHMPYRSSAQEPLTKFSGPPDSLYSTHAYTARDYGVSSSELFMGRQSVDLRFEEDERADDGGDGNDDDDDENDGDEEQPVPVAPASGSDGRPRHGKGRGLTGRPRNKKLDKACDVPAPTQRKRVKASNWEQTWPA
ncbi:hypothetical protein M9H77_35788 [Catharanthus roseus]|uniref:Uncharacterized protein n=1 Tax=Catharanthus roseus TaxID=4058 RepID=A0ACB9ZQR3_CATRO|nr:hypothetical protein M9H77_35788 [Catharanthus roseus]